MGKITWLHQARRQKGFTQAQAAQRVGISRYYYIDIENGRRVPAVKTARKIAAVLDVEWTRFFEDEDDEDPQSA